MTRRTVDLGQLHLTVHALLGQYEERPSRLVQDTSRARVDLALRTVDKDLAVFGVTDPDSHRARQTLQGSDLEPEDRRAAAVLLAVRDRLRRRLLPLPRRAPAGLLLQLTAPLPARGADDAGKVSSGKSGSRPPGTLQHLDLLVKIETGVIEHDCDMRDALDQHRGEDWHWHRMLWALPTLADQLGADHDLVRRLDRDLRSWHSSARVLLTYIAPMVTLTTPCPHCAQESLIVREDASSDVVCTTPECIDPKTDSASRWPRGAWQQLLAGRYATGVVNTDAAALHLGVAPATVRDWKRRGLLEPVGGTQRHPLWRVEDLDRAAREVAARAAKQAKDARKRDQQAAS